DGRVLTVVSAVSNDDSSTVAVDGDLVVITPGATPGVYGAVYTIENDVGGTSSNFVRVTVDPDAPLSRPVVTDTVLTLSDVGERDEVSVDVLANVFFADGNPRSLILSVQPGYEESARVTSEGLIRVNRADSSQIIPFRATHPSDPSVYSYGFIWAPGFDDALPQLNRNAPPLSVVSEEPLRINLAEYVLVTGDRQPRLTDASLVRATHGNGAALVVDDTTLVFTSADRYFGSASISFQVTDASDGNDPSAHTATLVLPITVLPRENQPPVFSGAVIDIEPAEERTIDLTRLTTYPYPDDADELAYTIETVPEGFTYALDGAELTLRANDTVPIGSQTAMTVGVRDAMAEGRPGRIQLGVVPSTRPLARASTDTAVVRRGETTTIDVLANDAATNPFPGSALTVTAIRGLDSASLPAGVRVTPSADRTTLVVDIADTAAPTDTALQYQVTDATGDPSRAVWGTVRISVQDRPDPVTTVRVTDLADEELTVAWNGGAFNNSPITGYRAVVSAADTGAVISDTECSGSPCDVATGGNGSANAVRVAVTASNAIGASDATSTAGRVWSDVVPLQPAALASSPVDGGLRITWNKPASSGGSPITRYVVTVGPLAPQEIEVPAGDDVGTSYETTITDWRLVNGSNVTFTVSARNDATESLVQWTRASATGTPAGAPIRASAPSATVTPDEAGTATLAWADGFNANGRPISNYYAAVFTGEAPTCTVSGTLPGTIEVPPASDSFVSVGTQTQTTFTSLDANTTYRFAVFAFNGMGCTDSVIVEATPRERPGTVTAATITEPLSSGAFTWDHQIGAVTVDGASDNITAVMYRFVGDEVEGSQHGPEPLGSFLLSTNGSHYGSNVRVELKACATYAEFTQPLCSAEWSEPLPVGVAINNTVLGGLDATLDETEVDTDAATTGQYSFTSSPEGQYSAVTYSCGAAAVPLTDGEAGECAVTAAADGASPTFPDLTVTITVDGTQYPRDYRWIDYD
ncbi:MAG TPA: fibronectin type III domain-containing protein, partial [Glaciihabitans sp.]|nr:fibronectin type III domain-containing protein [Glaciihabitans sp.]